MSFKSSLNVLLHSAAHLAMPAPEYTTMQLDGDHVVAPSSGYFAIRFKSIKAMASWFGASFGGINLLTNGSFFQDGRTEIMFPVRKGYLVVLTSYQADIEYIHFHKLVLGGVGILKVYQAVSAFVQGGAICLKTSCKRLLNPSSRARRATLRLSACQVGATLYKRLQSNRGQQLFLTTDGHVFKRIAIVYKRALSRLVLLLLAIKTTRGRQSYCQLKRVNTYNGTFLKTFKAKCLFGLFAIKQTNNLATEVCHG